MDINQLMNSLKETYGFSKTEWNELNGEPLAEFSLRLTEEHISRFIEKAGRLTAIIESCANMVSICEPELKDTLMATTIQCCGANQLKIRTSESMLKMLVGSIFD